MAVISAKIGPLLEELSYADDSKAAAVFQAFYLDQQLGPPDATNRQQLRACLVWFARQLTAKASQRHRQIKEAEAALEAATLYGLEP